MFPQASSSIYQSPTCFVTYGTMGHVDQKQIPSKGQPWKAALSQDFIHRVDLIAPQECYETLNRKLIEQRQPPTYSRVTMSLGQILDGDFFTEYIKRRNVLMLSEGKTTADNMFTLCQGILAMYLDKETYERAGLVGKPYGPKGSRGLKPRWIVTYDLASPTMLRGKKHFDRLVYACNKGLSRPLTWLFSDTSQPTLIPASIPIPLDKHYPTNFTSSPGLVRNIETTNVDLAIPAPILATGDRSGLEDVATDIYEWLSLIRLESPRAAASDDIDPYLSRYRAPGDADGQMNIFKMSWQGFLSSIWLRDLLVDVLAGCPSQSWFAISSTAFSKGATSSSDEWTLLRQPRGAGEYVMWENKCPG